MSRKNVPISRVTRSKNEAKASYDRMARWYDALAGRFEGKYRDLALRKVGAGEGETVLEIGYGTGHCLVALAQAVGESGRVHGIDISEEMRRIASRRVAESGLAARVDLKCGDAAALPYESGSFDAIFMSFALELFDTPEIPVVLAECKRVLRSGGRFGVVAMSRRGGRDVLTRLYEWLHKVLPNYVDCRPIFLRESVEGADFEVIDVTEVSLWGLGGEIVLARKT